MAIPLLTPYAGVAPSRVGQTQTEFSNNGDDMNSYYAVIATEMNLTIEAMNITSAQVDADAETAKSSAESAASSANFKGNWSDLTGPLNIPSSVFHNDAYWQLVTNLPDVTLSEPSSTNANWAVSYSELNEIARIKNVLNSEVISSIDTVTQLGPVKFILDSTQQVTFNKPIGIGQTETIVSIVLDTLTTSAGSYQLIRSYAPIENRLRGNQNFNVIGATGSTLPDATPRTYATGTYMSADWFIVASDAEQVTLIDGVLKSGNGTGVLRRTYPRDPADTISVANQFASVIKHDESQVFNDTLATTGVFLDEDTNKLYLDVALSKFPDGIKMITLGDGPGRASYISNEESADEYNKGLVISSTAQAQAGADDETAISPLKLREALNAAGSAPVYACRTWGNFNGEGTVSIRESGNVSSLVDAGPGQLTVNFITPLPDANYAPIVGGARRATYVNADQIVSIRDTASVLTTSISILTANTAGSAFDFNTVTLDITR